MKQAIFLATLCCAVAVSAAVVNLKKGANPVVVDCGENDTVVVTIKER